MAIITDSIIDVGNYITFNIGLSKSISNYTVDEIWNFPYCSSSWDAFRHICDQSYQGIAPGSIEASEYEMPFHFTGVNQLYVPATYNFEEGQIEYNQGDQGIYGRIIWLCETGNTNIDSIFGKQRCITNTDGVKIITQMDMTQVYLFLDTFQDPENHDIMYADYNNFKIKEVHEGVTTYEHARNASIFPAVMFKYNDKLYIHRIFQSSYTSLDWSWWLSYYGDSDHGGHTELQGHTFNSQPVAFTNDGNAYLPINIMRQFSGLRPVNTERFYTASDIEDVGVRYQWMYGYDGGRICPATESKYLQMISWYGGMFYHNGKYYKPIIEDGYVTGYTDDMSVRSDIDNWTGATNHNVPPGPPGPAADDEDNTDEIALTGAPFAAGLCHYYALTAGSVLLQHISEALGTWDIDTTKKDLYRNLISCKLIKPPAPIPSTGAEPFTIYGVKPQYEGADITLPVVTGNPENSFGPYKIDRKFNDFRDFAPYTKAEIFLPYCGWCALPSHVVGRKVTVKYYTDIIAATCKAVVFCNNNVVAEAAGVIGLDIPFASENVGAKMEAINAGLLATAAGGVQLAAGVGSMVSTKSSAGLKGAASGLSQYISGYTQMSMACNENWTEISGKNGDGCALAGITHIIIKVTRPKYGTSSTAPYVPSGYAHNIGYVSNKGITVGEASGLLICDNADTSGISGATDAERAEIKRVLETGIYVNSPPE